MSGTKTNRTDLENRFKKGMYPTENDFANVFASYVHKDDSITLSQITLEEGGDNLGEVIDSKADKQTLETFVREVETVLETTRDSETGAITNSAISSLAQRITDAENDIASAANAVETNEDSIAKILTILGKQNGESVSELASRFSALSGDYATVFAFVSKVKTFLESADVADTTINRWQEIETFLQGITDTETLTGLLQQMKQEILAEIPTPQSGNFIEYTTDLDAITDAPNGKIMQYWGQSNDKYKRGQFYERVGGKEIMIQTGTEGRSVHPSSIQTGFETFENRLVIFPTGDVLEGYATRNSTGEANLTEFVIGEVVAGNYAYMDEKCEITSPYEGAFYIHGHVGPFEWNVPIKIEVWISKSGKTIYKPTKMDGTSSPKDYYRQDVDGKVLESTVGDYVTIQAEQDIVYGESPSSWQHIHVDEVID